MASRKKPVVREEPTSQATERRRGDRRVVHPPAPIPIAIISIGLRELSLRELLDPAVAASRPLGAQIPTIKLALDASIDFPDKQVATLTLRAKVTDADPQPLVEVELRVTALFRYEGDLSERQVGSYLSKMGGGMLFPYVRETVHSVSGRTFFGPLLLQPTILTPLFSEAQLASLSDARVGGSAESA
ncbi:MAG: protein-export chaperone SecB [Gemmatimonadaceae bacterium]